jgi:hypothetical protein
VAGIEFERTEVMKRVADETVFVGVSLRSNVSKVAKSGNEMKQLHKEIAEAVNLWV